MDQHEKNLSLPDNQRLLQTEKNPGLLAGFWLFFMESKKWWLGPPLFLLLLLGVLIALSQTAAAPFIYTLF
jgi:hypothetical protein